jgi:hypothetical protein
LTIPVRLAATGSPQVVARAGHANVIRAGQRVRAFRVARATTLLDLIDTRAINAIVTGACNLVIAVGALLATTLDF